MKDSLAFIGDIHGEVNLLHEMLEKLAQADVQNKIFLGDYINKGGHSKDVIEVLIEQVDGESSIALLGNHEKAMLDVLRGAPLGPFLKMGGAAAIRSYFDGPVGPWPARDFKDAVPKRHKEFLASLPEIVTGPGFVAGHHRPPPELGQFQVSGHVFVGPEPRITRNSARLDTGAGNRAGRLTALLWPSRTIIQTG